MLGLGKRHINYTKVLGWPQWQCINMAIDQGEYGTLRATYPLLITANQCTAIEEAQHIGVVHAVIAKVNNCAASPLPHSNSIASTARWAQLDSSDPDHYVLAAAGHASSSSTTAASKHNMVQTPDLASPSAAAAGHHLPTQ
jgi:hypothetical protein